jgi:cardiolipin synthase
VGTANVDIRSFEQNFEVNLIVYDRHIAKALAAHFVEDLANSEEESEYRWRFRPKRERVKESIARLFAPLL